MVRSIVQEFLLFLLPFALFAIQLLIRRKSPFRWAHWSDQALWLVIAGLVIAVGSLVAGGLVAERHQNGFVPTHMENGRVVPGEFR